MPFGGLVQAWSLGTEVAFYLFIPVWAGTICRLLPRRALAGWGDLAGCGLLYAVAKHEDALSRSGSRDVRDPETERLARESLALLLDIGLDSAAARLLSLRLLRRPWSSAPAPSARTSALIVFVAVAIGALVGWLLDEGFDRFFHR